jgi:cytochrome c-type biogenesis protein
MFAFAFAAGILSTLSPCVLPILPIVIAGAAAQGRLAIVWLAGGLALSFTAIGLFVATIGFAAGLDADLFRAFGALAMLGIGIVLVVPALQMRAAAAMGPVGDWTERRLGGFSTDGNSGQFALGLLLGAVWGPCVGPTLGAASLMAARGENLPEVAATMLMFGLGAATPLLALCALSRQRIMGLRERLMLAGSRGKTLLGGALVVVGLLVLTGADKRLEAAILDAMPDWLARLTTSI